MKRNKYQAGLRVKQRPAPGHASIRRSGVTVSESLTIRRYSDGEDYCLVRWDGSSRSEWVHYASIDIVEEVSR